jgi:hypothetical protein
MKTIDKTLRVVQVLLMFPLTLIAGVYLAITEHGVTVRTRLSKLGELIRILPAAMIMFVESE